MKLTTVGMDLEKNVIQVHGVDGHGKARIIIRVAIRHPQGKIPGKIALTTLFAGVVLKKCLPYAAFHA